VVLEDEPSTPAKAAAGPLLTIVGSLLALAGTIAARGSPIAAHAVLATGVVIILFRISATAVNLVPG
jgi:hypothetical protein